MKILAAVFTILFSVSLNAQSYKGPAQGSISAGSVTLTDTFNVSSPVKKPAARNVKNVLTTDIGYQSINFGKAEKSIVQYFEDPALVSPLADTARSLLLNNWRGIAETNSIPPDPYIAAGPQHIMAVVNSRFAIWDKKGNQVANIDADAWYQNLVNGVSSFDPKVVYDHFDKRWIMVWLEQNGSTKLSYYLVSVSDDSIPTGKWYNWAIPAYKNGSESDSSWSDFQGVGFDDKAIYFTSNQVTFPGSALYPRIKIIPKDKLYANTAGELSWFDIWDIRLSTGTQPLWTLRPTIQFSKTDKYHFLYAPNEGGNFLTLFILSDPLTNPVLTLRSFSVTPFKLATNAQQFGGGAMNLETAGTKIWQEPVYREGYLWCVHSIRNPKSEKYSALHYLKYNVTENKVEEDFVFGATGYWHYYPVLAVDKDQNVVISYSRSGDKEFPGAFYTSRFKNAPAGFEASKPLKSGRANYVKDYASGRNRWGDYNGIWLDPSDQNNVWMFTEYAEGINTWGTWVGCVRLVPYDGVRLSPGTSQVNFNATEVDRVSDTLRTAITNVGKDDLVITSIQNSSGPFRLITGISFPVTLKTYESINVSFVFTPAAEGEFEENFAVTSNDAAFAGFALSGKGYKIHAAQTNKIYAPASGTLVNIDPASAAVSTIGYTLFSRVNSLAIEPKSNILYGTVSAGNINALVRISAREGDGYFKSYIQLADINSISFDTSGTLYGTSSTGELYQLNISDGSTTIKSNIKMTVASIAFDPVTNELYAAAADSRRLYRVNINTGDTIGVGNAATLAIKTLGFNMQGVLYALTAGAANRPDTLVILNKSNGVSQVIGSTGRRSLTSIAIGGALFTSVSEERNLPVPDDFTLSQNYPNPFNPSTTIEYGLPVDARVRIVIYNLLGQSVKELVNTQQTAGNYKLSWDGGNLSSGVYFYELKAADLNGKEFSEMKKMILMK